MYIASFNTGSTYYYYKFTNKKEARKFIIAVARGNTPRGNKSTWKVISGDETIYSGRTGSSVK